MIKDYYFDWLVDLVCSQEYSERLVYRKLLRFLFEKEFVWSIPSDENRYYDGLDLRDVFFDEYSIQGGNPLSLDEIYSEFNNKCNLLEMMIALSKRCVVDLLGDEESSIPMIFWKMIINLGLNPMNDYNFDGEYVERIIDIFLNRKYSPNGYGGNIFVIKDIDSDLSQVEIWSQLCWYADDILNLV